MTSSKVAAVALSFATVAFLSACADDAADGPGHCPQIRTYTPAEEKAITRAMQALPPDNPLVNAMLDYEELRDEARLCARARR
jgi:hypothetical protein